MAITLSSSDATTVLENRKNPRPTFFDAIRTKDVTISEDFEAFLILSSDKAKEQGATWISTFAGQQKPDLVRSNLLKEWCENEQTDMEAMANKATDRIAEFNDWRNSFSAGKFGSVTEVGALVGDLSYLIDETVFLSNKYQHANVVALIQSGKINSNQKDENQIKQSQSWVGPLLAY